MNRLIFYHIPKCGGTSVFEALKKHYVSGEVCSLRNRAAHSRTAMELNRYNLFCGHYSPPRMRMLINPPYKEALLLRDPIQQVISSYHYCRSHKHKWIYNSVDRYPGMDYAAAKTMGLSEYVESNEKMIRDHMLRRVSGRLKDYYSSAPALLEDARTVVDEIDLVGTLEDGMKLFLAQLFHLIDARWDGVVPHATKFENLYKDFNYCEKIERQSVTPKTLELIIEFTKGDRQLYEYIKEKSYAKSIKN